MGWFSNLFTRKEKNPIRQPRRDGKVVDWTSEITVDTAVTKAIYNNSFPDTKLAGAIAYLPVANPTWFMGLPTIKTADEVSLAVKRVVEKHAKLLHIRVIRDGAVWLFPWFDGHKIQIKFIDPQIVKVYRDIETEEVTRITAWDNVLMADLKTYERKRQWTPDEYRVTLNGQTTIYRNTLRIMPIEFSVNEGHGVYERIIYDLKDYHDIDLARSRMLAKFQPKMVQEGTQSVSDWLANNGWASIADIDIAATDFIYNIMGKEKTTFEFPQGAFDAYHTALKDKFKKIVEGSGVPEIFWGVKIEGNHASAKEQREMAFRYVDDIRDQLSESYTELYRALMALASTYLMEPAPDEWAVTWNELDSISPEARAVMLRDFGAGVDSLMKTGVIGKDQLHSLWNEYFPGATTDDFDEWKRDISDMARHGAFAKQDYLEMMGDDTE